MKSSGPSSAAVRAIADAWRTVGVAYLSDDVLLAITEALQRKDLRSALEALPRVEENVRFVKFLSDQLARVYERTANREYARVGSSIRAVVKALPKRKPDTRENRFAMVPHSKKWIVEEAARLVVEITDEQRDTLANLLVQRYDPTRRPEVIVRQIKSVVGLTAHEGQAVLNRELKLRDDADMSDEQIARETARYAEHLHQLRGERIARTEAVFVETQAKQDAWEIARDDGVLPQGARKEWIVNEGACPKCALMEGQVVDLDAPFISRTEGPLKGPPLHPHCLCAAELSFRERKGSRAKPSAIRNREEYQ